jgi:hypothetical protein
VAQKNGLKEQIQRNLVALISLSIAVAGLAYNTWRNEASEHNRNQRLVSIQILVMLGEFQQVVLDRGHGEALGAEQARRKGWALALTVRDIAMVADGDVLDASQTLFEVWKKNSIALRRVSDTDLAKDRASQAQKAIEAAIDSVRRETQQVLRDLD